MAMKKTKITEEQRYILISRALSMGGINTNPQTVELILSIIELADRKGEAISLQDVTDLAITVDVNAKQRLEQKKKNPVDTVK